VLTKIRHTYQKYILKKFVRYKKIYIMPTKSGYSFIAASFLLFLAGIIYGNNIVLTLAFLGFSFFIIEMFQTHYALKNIDLKLSKINDFFADSQQPLSLFCSHTEFSYLNIKIEDFETSYFQNEKSDDKEKTILTNISQNIRGHYKPKNIQIILYGEFNLFKSWVFLEHPLEFYVYPKRIDHHEFKNSMGTIDLAEEFYDHKKADKTSLTKINWKLFQKTNQLYEKKYHAENANTLEIYLQSNPSEEEISQVTTQVYYQGQDYDEVILHFKNEKVVDFKINKYETIYQRLATI
jgi:hypothetical protein